MSRIRYPCKEDDTRPCRESCREWMRAECDGQNYMLTAGGAWTRNQIRLRKRIEESKNVDPEVAISIEYGLLPPGVRVDKKVKEAEE